jgi:hypothetical protein
LSELPEYIDGLPNICGCGERLDAALQQGPGRRVFASADATGFGDVESAFAIALHIHQPLIPAGGVDLHTASTIGNLAWMMANPGIGDNHNAPAFLWCYKRSSMYRGRLILGSRTAA